MKRDSQIPFSSPDMKIVIVSWVRNESDVLEAFVRHHCALVDRMIIVSHRSQDNSQEILMKLAKEGLPIDVRQDERLSHAQSAVITSLTHEAFATYGAGWVIPLDADEFIRIPKGRTLHEILEKEKGDMPLEIAWRGYVPMPTDDPLEANVLRKITHRRIHEDPERYKVAIPRQAACGETCIVLLGSHAVTDGKGQMLAAKKSEDITLAHFPIRSVQQVRTKAVGGWISYASDPIALRGAIFQWKALFEKVRRGGVITAKELACLATQYATNTQWKDMGMDGSVTENGAKEKNTHTDETVVSDTVPCEFKVKYVVRMADAWQVLTTAAEDLAHEHAVLLRRLQER